MTFDKLIFGLAVVFAAGPLLAKQETKTYGPPSPEIVVQDSVTYHLLQIKLEGRKDLEQKFRSFASEIRDCHQARLMQKRLPVKIAENRNVSGEKLPESLRDEVRDLRVGQATRVLTELGKGVRVIVVCDRFSGSAP